MERHTEKGKRPMPFTEEQMRQVFDTNLIDFAVKHGYEIEKGDRNTVHVKHSGGLYLFKHGRGYYQFAGGKSGNIIQFVQEYMGIADFKDAVGFILGCRAYEQTEHYVPVAEKEPKGKLVLPEKDRGCNQTFAYLTKTRGIDCGIVGEMIKQGKIYQTITHKDGYRFKNCAFVGYDENGKARYCALRAPGKDSKFRQDVENSDKTYGFCMEGHSNRVYEFEAPIDAMSHATLCKLYGMDWQEDHRVAEGCLSDKALARYLKLHPEIREIVFCYDNDMDGRDAKGQPHNHGQVQAERSAAVFKKAGYKVYIQTPQGKDFNEDLMVFWEKMEQEEKNLKEIQGMIQECECL